MNCFKENHETSDFMTYTIYRVDDVSVLYYFYSKLRFLTLLSFYFQNHYDPRSNKILGLLSSDEYDPFYTMGRTRPFK